ncbi:hypothetical protein BD410DRAFT_861978 [Rickenella mellea]|uniref:t-SNARE coiled-coil homology domain-containing protein n=1 Tax=Rickenella mellea TaxID=50990 RepID=A0A4Y7QLD8_9AGAM|nr:hypothetical protein BD410DRAFT_861978 [Rickenella mellea]
MPLFKRKEQLAIPPVADSNLSSNKPPSYRSSNSSTYVASRDGDPYNPTPVSYTSPSMTRSSSGNDNEWKPPSRGPLGRNNGITDPYSRGERNIDTDRNELFAGYNPEKAAGSNRFNDGPPGRRTPPPGEEQDEDVEGIKQQTRFTKQESVNSTRNALRLAREAEETATITLGRLGDQSEKLGNTERHLDVAKGHSLRAEDNAIQIKRLNKSIFNPSAALSIKRNREGQENKRMQALADEREEREAAMRDIRESQNRVGRATTYGRGNGDDDDDDDEGIARPGRGRVRTEERKRYQFEATASDDELEDELDDNLGEISDVAKRLKALGSAMGHELDHQNQRIQRIEGKTVKLSDKVDSNTDRLKRIR